ncbi:MAG: flagellar filament capping protein FliD [Gemmatimonadaceae bacterium]
MTSPVASISGLSSSINWNDIIDQLVKVEQDRTVTPLTTAIDNSALQKTAWNTYRGLVEKMNDSARTLRAGGIGGYVATAGTSPNTGRAIVAATASSSASAGNYQVEVLQLAQAAKISGSAVSSSSAALGFTGDFSVNGTTINVGSADSLADIRTKINNANTGATPNGVTATILSNGNGGGRLVLTRDTPGASGIALSDGSGGLTRELGFLDSRSKTVSTTTVSIAAGLGLAVVPSPATMRVNGHVISVDLSVDSIASIVAKINAAGGQASSQASSNGDTSGFQIAADGNVTADPNDANSQAVIDALGFAAGQSASVSQSVTSPAFTTAANAPASASTLLTDLKVGGVATNVAIGDAINVRGTRGDGTAVTVGVTVDPGETLQTLIDKINNSTNGFGAGGRTATATLGDDGAIHLTDDTGGESRLTLSFSVAKADNSAGTFGSTSVSSVGRQREVSKGQDAEFRVDGVLLSRSSNTVTDAIGGVTLNLESAEEGTTVNLNVARNDDSAVTAIKGFADSYNSIVKFFEEQRVVGAPLYGNSSLRSSVSSLTDSLRTKVATNATYSTLSVTGLSLNKFGTLDIDESKFKFAIDSKSSEVEALFGFAGVGQAVVGATDNSTRFGTGIVSSQITSLDDSVRRLKLRADQATSRLDLMRQNLVSQYTQMETALATLKAQGSYLTSAIAGLSK